MKTFQALFAQLQLLPCIDDAIIVRYISLIAATSRRVARGRTTQLLKPQEDVPPGV